MYIVCVKFSGSQENNDTNHEVWALESNAQRYAIMLPCNFGCSGVRLWPWRWLHRGEVRPLDVYGQ